MTNKNLKFKYDLRNDILEVEGIKYSGELFRKWGIGGMETGTFFKIERDPTCPTTITLHTYQALTNILSKGDFR